MLTQGLFQNQRGKTESLQFWTQPLETISTAIPSYFLCHCREGKFKLSHSHTQLITVIHLTLTSKLALSEWQQWRVWFVLLQRTNQFNSSYLRFQVIRAGKFLISTYWLFLAHYDGYFSINCSHLTHREDQYQTQCKNARAEHEPE